MDLYLDQKELNRLFLNHGVNQNLRVHLNIYLTIDKSKVFKISQNLLQDEANSLFTIDDDSMSPDIQIGDKVILKEISESDLEFGKTYLISTEFDGKTNSDLRKIIKPGSLKPGYGILKPLNPDWAESEVELDKINIVGKVVSVIKDYN